MLEWLADALRDPETAALAVSGAGLVGLMMRAYLKSFRDGRDAEPDRAAAMRAIGAGLTGSLDGTKVSEILERIAASLASIAASAATIAKLEEQGTAEAIEAQGKKIDDLLARLPR